VSSRTATTSSPCSSPRAARTKRGQRDPPRRSAGTRAPAYHPTSTYGATTHCACCRPADPTPSHSRGNAKATRVRLLKYFVNLEEPFRRTSIGFDTQDHTLDIEFTPALDWRWRDEQELANHVTEGFYTAELAAAARAEGERVIDAVSQREHECLRGWADWNPPPEWGIPAFVAGWDTTPPTFWDRRDWAYGDDRS